MFHFFSLICSTILVDIPLWVAIFLFILYFSIFCKFNFEIRFTLELQSYQTNKFIRKYFLCDIILMIREIERREERSKVAGIALGLFSVKREEGT